MRKTSPPTPTTSISKSQRFVKRKKIVSTQFLWIVEQHPTLFVMRKSSPGSPKNSTIQRSTLSSLRMAAGQETSSKTSAKLKSKSLTRMASPVRQCSTMHFMSPHSIRTYSLSVQRQKMEPQFHSARTRVTSIQMERILASPRETTSTTWIRYHQFRFLHRAMSVR